ncbi:MAG: transposase [Phycisphaeraceae bacterium]|nr:transposase [Phycisphaeraceae bacterium]
MHDHAHWRRLLREQRRSGLSIVEFCRVHGVSPSSFHRWRRMLAGDGSASHRRDDRPSFVELAAPPSISGPGVVITIAGGRRIEIASGADEAWVARFVVRLERLDAEAAS